jgi:hypothetical protein
LSSDHVEQNVLAICLLRLTLAPLQGFLPVHEPWHQQSLSDFDQKIELTCLNIQNKLNLSDRLTVIEHEKLILRR